MAAEVLDFWFGMTTEQHFARNDALDRTIIERFSVLRNAILHPRLELTRSAIKRGWDERYPPDRRVFLYMPLMHAEDVAMQDLSVAKFEALGIEESLAFARDHRNVIADHDRFPSRNAALDRESTAAEEAYLARPGAGW